ncbi:MAG: radical SAM protein [Spirochaetaceae bacterium]|jgi:MoaA/NifB/PqqE/SkfB family radical SAM enzyme|nr:radical SAM protein [Spirochaetaceae bacterium]
MMGRITAESLTEKSAEEKNEEQKKLTGYLNAGVRRFVRDILRISLKNPAERVFLGRYLWAAKKAETLRRKASERGEHIPPFLIAGITARCNLACPGCYDRALRIGGETSAEMTREEWGRIFKEAAQIGASAILLAGGEPLMRPDVLETAAHYPSLLFPVFTNATLLNDSITALFDGSRNLIPVLSVEGTEAFTDSRRGTGVYARIAEAMEKLSARDILFGVSITVSRDNLAEAVSGESIEYLFKKGCRGVVFVEYVPVESPERALAPEDRLALETRVAALRKRRDMVIISFPADEAIAGCLAAGRGFFYINPAGGAEPCPFSPYSDRNVRAGTLREALQSPLFAKLREDGLLRADRSGGCTLFAQADYVKNL